MKFGPASVLVLAAVCATSVFHPAPVQAAPIEPGECLVIGRVGASSRSPIHTDAIETQSIVAGNWRCAAEGGRYRHSTGRQRSSTGARLNESGNGSSDLQRQREQDGGYAYDKSYLSARLNQRVMFLLEAAGHSMVYVNGVPRTGDPYSTGWTRLPVKLHSGNNDLLFLCGRGSLRVKLTDVPAGKQHMLDSRDLTLPDLRVGEKLRSQGAIVVVNATEAWTQKLSLRVTAPGLAAKTTSVPTIAPLGTRKISFPIEGRAPDEAEIVHVGLELTEHEGKNTPDRIVVDLRVRKPFPDHHKRTFVKVKNR